VRQHDSPSSNRRLKNSNIEILNFSEFAA